MKIEDLSAEITIPESMLKEKKSIKITKLRDILNSQADSITIVKKIIDGKIEFIVGEVYVNIPAL